MKKYTKEELLKIAQEHKEYFTSGLKWNEYALEHDLPNRGSYTYAFGNWNAAKKSAGLYFTRTGKTFKYTTDELIEIAQEHKEYFTTVVFWDDFASKHELPMAHFYYNRFGTWDEAKKRLKLLPTVKRMANYTKADMLEIAKEHKEHFTSSIAWDEYASKHDLPKSHLFYRMFGSWNEPKVLIETDKPIFMSMRDEFTDSELELIIQQHREQFTTIGNWNRHAEINNLPTAFIFIYHKGDGTWNGFKKCYGLPIVLHKEPLYSYSDLIVIAREHSRHFTTNYKWDDYARRNQLPKSNTYIIRFGSWNKAKETIFQDRVDTR